MNSDELLKYFIEKTDKRFDMIEKKLDDLNSWKFKVIGGSIVLSFLVTLIIKLIFHT